MGGTRLSDMTGSTPGLPCLRAMSSISRRAQQSALDSHKVSGVRARRFEVITSFLRPGEETMILTDGWVPRQGAWSASVGNSSNRVVVCPVSLVTKASLERVLGTYDFRVLGLIGDVESRSRVCHEGLVALVKYSGAKTTPHDLACLSSYLTHISGEGQWRPLCRRDDYKGTRWLDTMVSLSYSSFMDMTEAETRGVYPIVTFNECGVFGNFKGV